MLAITTDAAQVIKQIVTSSELGRDGGIRVSVEAGDGQSAKLAMAIAGRPEPGDAHVEQEGANVFLDPNAAPFLDDKVLNATIESGQPAFSLADNQS